MAKTLGITFAIGASVAPSVASAFSTVEQKMRASQAKMRELSDKSKVLAAANAARQRVVATQRAFAASGGRDPMLREALTQELAAFNKAAAAAKKYGVAIADLARAHAQTDKALAATRVKLESLQKAQAYKEKREEAASSIRAAAVPALALAAPIKEAIQFESAMADAAKTIDGMRDDAGKLTPKYYEMETAIKQLGQTIPLTHEEIAKLFAAGGQQGMTGVNDLREFTEIAAQMSVAFGMGTEEAADAIGGYRSALNLTMPEARSLLDLMNQYANTTSASEKGIADVVRRIGSLGAVGGVAAKPVTALAATLDAMKVAPEVAATGIKNLILAMTAGSAATKGQKEAFASLRIDTVKLAKQMQVDGPAAIVSVLEAIKKLPKAKQLSTMQQIFGKESLGSIAPLLANLDQVKQNLIICGDESKYAGAMQQEFANRNDTTANKLVLLSNQVKEFGITVAGNLLPAIQSVAQTVGPAISAVSAFAGEHKGLTTAAIGVVASLVGLKVGVAAVTWVASGLGGAFNLAKAALAGFSVVTKIAAGVQTAFNAVMAANPVGIAVMAVAALGAGLVYLYKTCEPVRVVFDKVFSWIADKIQSVVAGFKSIGGAIKSVAGWLGFGGGDEQDDTAKTQDAAEQTVAVAAQEPIAATPRKAPAAEDFAYLYAGNGVPAGATWDKTQPTTAQSQNSPTAAPTETPVAVVSPSPEIQAKTPPVVNPNVNLVQNPENAIPEIALTQAAAQTPPVAPKLPEIPAIHAATMQLPDMPVLQVAVPDIPAIQVDMPNLAQQQQQPTQSGQAQQNLNLDALLRQLQPAETGRQEKKQAGPAAPDTQIVQPQVQVQLTVKQNGVPDQEFATGVINALKSRQADLEAMISAIVNEQARLAYG